ncbi:hypothetical protein SAMN05421739_102503 [Pontibacter chinhatensis]|uniref:DUF4365 domain-containing protein n=2 Tax=Pontibacter chinhatensis TaxID=1436961 RepID=A0A1I2RRG9_9BACT|nr:hypothetical protein SAMN05421739_102503 [Pontibacter chinhatensis]
MRDASEIANRAASAIERKLWSQPSTVDVVNVEDDAAYQSKDIDILWRRKLEDGSIKTIKIEVKGDRHYYTGNYFLETISNESKGTPGCFMYTEADFVYYYFVDEGELHILPMPATRDWFKKHLSQFKERKTSTPVGNGKHYVTVGRLVPRHVVLANVPGVKILKL